MRSPEATDLLRVTKLRPLINPCLFFIHAIVWETFEGIGVSVCHVALLHIYSLRQNEPVPILTIYIIILIFAIYNKWITINIEYCFVINIF